LSKKVLLEDTAAFPADYNNKTVFWKNRISCSMSWNESHKPVTYGEFKNTYLILIFWQRFWV